MKQYKTPRSRRTLAKNTKDPDVLRSLMSDPDPSVKKIAASRITDPHDLAALMRDPNVTIAARAARSLKFSIKG